MDDIIVKNANVLLDDGIYKKLNVCIKGNKISYVGKEKKEAKIVIDCKNKILAPGYIDIHTHGALNHDCIENNEDAQILISKYHAKNGTTAYCPTYVAAPIKTMQKANDLLKKLKKEKKLSSRVLGVHIEGTFCSKRKCGAQDISYLLDLDDQSMKFFENNSDIIKRITLAPDIKNSKEITQLMNKLNIQVSLGHDDSYEDEILECIKAGANSVTHLFNCTSNMKRIDGIKKLGLTEIGLSDDRLYAELIADTHHVPNNILNLVKKAKSLNKIIPVSDSIPVAGLSDDDISYMDIINKKRPIKIKNGVGVLIETNTCAGSITNVASIIKTLKKEFNINNFQAIKLGFEPAINLLKIKKLGKIKVGYYADLNILDSNLDVELTIADGKLV